jgi:hypothetical protein
VKILKSTNPGPAICPERGRKLTFGVDKHIFEPHNIKSARKIIKSVRKSNFNQILIQSKC